MQGEDYAAVRVYSPVFRDSCKSVKVELGSIASTPSLPPRVVSWNVLFDYRCISLGYCLFCKCFHDSDFWAKIPLSSNRARYLLILII